VRKRHRLRNAVVLGGPPPEGDVRRAFHGIERHLLDIYLGMLSLLADIANDIRPRSVATPRRKFASRIEMFFRL
jgi:hypothetical protein